MNNLLDFDPDLRLLTMPRPEYKYGWCLGLGILNEKKSIKYSKLVYHLFFPKEDIIWLTNVWEQIKKGRKGSFDRVSFPKEIRFDVDKQLQLIRETILERYS